MEFEQKFNLEKFAQDDFKAKKALWEKEADYYPQKIKELDLKSIDRFIDYHPKPSKLMKFKVNFAHKGLESIAEAMEKQKPWAVISRLNPSNPLHFGHKLILDELLWLQKQGADIYIPISNDESHIIGKSKNLDESKNIAYEKIIPSIISMGFNSKKTHIFVDSDYPDIYNVAMGLSKHLMIDHIFEFFNFGKDEKKESLGALYYKGAVQQAEILFPQCKEFGGPKPTLIPTSIDEYPYILLARDTAKKVNLIPPAALFLKFQQGLDNKGEMSADRPKSSIFLTDEPKIAENKIKNAHTGGSPLPNFQKEHGGVPGICPIYYLRTYHFEEDKKVEKECNSGEILCGDCKNIAAKQVSNFLASHQERLHDASKRIEEFTLKTPIRSILK